MRLTDYVCGVGQWDLPPDFAGGYGPEPGFDLGPTPSFPAPDPFGDYPGLPGQGDFARPMAKIRPKPHGVLSHARPTRHVRGLADYVCGVGQDDGFGDFTGTDNTIDNFPGLPSPPEITDVSLTDFAGLPDFTGLAGAYEPPPNELLGGVGQNAGFSGGTEVLGPPAPTGSSSDTTLADIFNGVADTAGTVVGAIGVNWGDIFGGGSSGGGKGAAPGSKTGTGGASSAATKPGASSGAGLGILLLAGLVLLGGKKR